MFSKSFEHFSGRSEGNPPVSRIKPILGGYLPVSGIGREEVSKEIERRRGQGLINKIVQSEIVLGDKTSCSLDPSLPFHVIEVPNPRLGLLRLVSSRQRSVPRCRRVSGEFERSRRNPTSALESQPTFLIFEDLPRNLSLLLEVELVIIDMPASTSRRFVVTNFGLGG
jgi:hypothetical protein